MTMVATKRGEDETESIFCHGSVAATTAVISELLLNRLKPVHQLHIPYDVQDDAGTSPVNNLFLITVLWLMRITMPHYRRMKIQFVF